MAGETPIHLVGNLTEDPELRFTPEGRASCRFTVASTPRIFDRQSQEWRDGDALFLPVTVTGEQAERIAEGLARGDRVHVEGRLAPRSWERRDGSRATRLEVEGIDVAASLRWASVSVSRAQRGQPQDQGGDPWASQVPGASGFGSGPAPGAGSERGAPPF